MLKSLNPPKAPEGKGAPVDPVAAREKAIEEEYEIRASATRAMRLGDTEAAQRILGVKPTPPKFDHFKSTARNANVHLESYANFRDNMHKRYRVTRKPLSLLAGVVAFPALLIYLTSAHNVRIHVGAARSLLSSHNCTCFVQDPIKGRQNDKMQYWLGSKNR